MLEGRFRRGHGLGVRFAALSQEAVQEYKSMATTAGLRCLYTILAEAELIGIGNCLACQLQRGLFLRRGVGRLRHELIPLAAPAVTVVQAPHDAELARFMPGDGGLL